MLDIASLLLALVAGYWATGRGCERGRQSEHEGQ